MELKNLQTFVKIIELNSFTLAGKSLGYSQTTVSAQIKKLEEELGTPLFDRMGHNIKLTSAGERFYPHALAVLKTADEALASINTDAVPEGLLRIGTSSSLAMEILSKVVPAYVSANPKVKVNVSVSNDAQDLFAKLLRGEVDLVYLLDLPIDNPNCVKYFEHPHSVVFVANSNNPITKREHITINELLQEPFVTSDREASYFPLFGGSAAAPESFEPSIAIGSVSAVVAEVGPSRSVKRHVGRDVPEVDVRRICFPVQCVACNTVALPEVHRLSDAYTHARIWGHISSGHHADKLLHQVVVCGQVIGTHSLPVHVPSAVKLAGRLGGPDSDDRPCR